MLLNCRLLVPCALLALLPPVSADVLTVGPAGSGADFQEIQAAVDAAADDDVLLVQPGSYQQVVVQKPLYILGDGTGVVSLSGPGFGLRVLDLAADEELVVSGVEVEVTSFSSSPVVEVRDCLGTVVVHDTTASGEGFQMTGLGFFDCTRALVLDCHIGGSGTTGTLTVIDSALWLANSEIEGHLVLNFDGAPPGIYLEGAVLHAWRTRSQGSDSEAFTPKSGGQGGPGILALGSTLELFGGAGSELQGGQGAYDSGLGFSHAGGAGLRLLLGSVARVQAGIPIAGGLDGLGLVQAPAISSDGSSTHDLDSRTFPTLSASAQQVQLGNAFSVTQNGAPGSVSSLYLSLRTGPVAPQRGLHGLSVLDCANLFRIESMVLPPSGTHTFHLVAPPVPALVGATLFFQSAEHYSKFALRRAPAVGFPISNPVLVTLGG